MDSWERLACYPQGTFYPLSDHTSTRDGRVTMPCFRTCLTCLSRSQAPLCHCTRRLISNQPEGTFGRLRYLLGGDRPSQTTRLPRSRSQIMAPVSISDTPGWCSIGAEAPTYALQAYPKHNDRV